MLHIVNKNLKFNFLKLMYVQICISRYNDILLYSLQYNYDLSFYTHAYLAT